MATPTPLKPKLNSKASYLKPRDWTRIHIYLTTAHRGGLLGRRRGLGPAELWISAGMTNTLSSSGSHRSPHSGTFMSPRGRDLDTKKLSAITRSCAAREPLHCLGTGPRPCTVHLPWPWHACPAGHRLCTYVSMNYALCTQNLSARGTCQCPCDLNPKPSPSQQNSSDVCATGLSS